ncbi:hypothetical protein BV87_10290 [Sphingobium yanoikuyae]|uniref:Uncharacterized protein n=1 Tax=Sphingobium yanoikuyae TaxID=13690 RepID=A0A2D1R1M9_SPHYA|nr:hypothetical protein BV87_10290 [Sphingobium yanoikuyae]TKV43681.1 hypothetical protein A0U87_12595 [Sphingobium sp. MP9-4]
MLDPASSVAIFGSDGQSRAETGEELEVGETPNPKTIASSVIRMIMMMTMPLLAQARYRRLLPLDFYCPR